MKLTERRTAGVLVPLFSIRGGSDWGIGEFPHLGELAPWLSRAGMQVLMTLPLLEVSPGQTSPYGALSGFALEPAYLALDGVEEFEQLGGERALPPRDRTALESARSAPAVDWDAVRRLKLKWLRRCFERFVGSGAMSGSQRGRQFAHFRARHGEWLLDYSLFRALKQASPHSFWQAWTPALRHRDPEALSHARGRLALECAFHEYLQWQAQLQLAEARAEADRHGVALAGDLPFMVAEDSADAWVHQELLCFDATVGAPPDAYSEEGQDWGLPPYRWDALERTGFQWLRRRGERAAEAFDLVRVDHVVGFYRTYLRPRDRSPPYFSPALKREQLRQGEWVMAALGMGGAELVAEDLGTVPPFVRESLARLRIPGFRVLRWEKDQDVFRDPATWPALSVATTGTHDTEPIADWWGRLPDGERTQLCRLPALEALGAARTRVFGPRVHQAILEAVYSSGSNLLILPIQDVFGLAGRINLPGTVGPDNWTWRLPWSCGQLLSDPEVGRHTSRAAELAAAHRRRPDREERDHPAPLEPTAPAP